MALIEQSGLMKHKDADGNVYLLYPITTKENVDGLENIDAHLEDRTIHVTTDEKTAWNNKAEGSHTHTIAEVSNLQNELDGKAATNHGTHVSYSTTDPAMNGTASVGSASTVARSDHKHPTDTSRAAKTDLDSHVSDTTKHITSTERTNWGSAYTHSQVDHAPSNAEKNQNAFSNVKVGDTIVGADTATDTLTLVGSNVTITPDATNDKITIGVATGSTSTAGIFKLTDSTSSTSTTTAATPNSVKSAYDLANAAKTAADNAQSTADGKANVSHTHTVANITDLTVTADELNYMDGVTSNVQTQLDGKAASSHSHSDATTSAAGFMTAAMVTKLNGIDIGANKIIVDSALSSTSANPVQNKVINTALAGKLSTTGGTLTGNLTGKYLTGTWLQTTEATRLGSTPTKFLVLDTSGWIYYRTSDDLKTDLGIPSLSGYATQAYVTQQIQAAIDATWGASY